jgi:hypothetical protein
MRFARFALVALFAAIPVGRAHAQGKPQTRDGFTIAFGVGSGSVGFTCDFCSSDRRKDGTAFLRIGGAISPNIILAGQTRGWTHEEAGETTTVGFLLGDVLFYPMSESGLYVEGGLGIGTMSNKDNNSGDELTLTGGALSVGTGYDIRVGRNFSLTPFIAFAGTGKGTPKQNGTTIPGGRLSTNLWQFGIGFTWH